MRQIVVAVDRTGRLVRQLLDMSAIEVLDGPEKQGVVRPGPILRQMDEDLADPARQVSVSVCPGLDDVELEIEPELFTLAVRT